MIEGLYERIVGTTKQICCSDCDRWMWEADNGIKHSSRCSTPDLQPTSEESKVEAPKATYDTSRNANGLSSDELLAKVQRGYLSQSEAMNADY